MGSFLGFIFGGARLLYPFDRISLLYNLIYFLT